MLPENYYFMVRRYNLTLLEKMPNGELRLRSNEPNIKWEQISRSSAIPAAVGTALVDILVFSQTENLRVELDTLIYVIEKV